MKTTKDFIENSKNKHGDRYDYSLSDYINARTKVKIICPEHGEFEQIPRQHESGYNCPKCSGRNKTNEEFINEIKLIHGDIYEYSKVEYKNNRDKIKIICNKHGEFEQKPKDHLLGKGCPKCVGKNMNTDDYIRKAKLVHGNRYDYSLVIYTKARNKIKIICPIHGEFEQTANSHLNGKGCPMCKESKGEKIIREYLIDNNIHFVPQYKFPDCKNIRQLPFDFYLPDYNTCIEYNGEQHYKPMRFLGGEEKFIQTQKNDKIKYDYCKNNSINLLILNDLKTIIKNLVKIL